MSRFLQVLNEHDRPIDAELRRHGHRMVDRPMPKTAASRWASRTSSTNSHPEQHAEHARLRSRLRGREDRQPHRYLGKVLVGATSLCPCSKAISEYGAHNQRSHITMNEGRRRDAARGSHRDRRTGSLLRALGVLKREDEKYVTERAYENPKFVKDLVRDVAARLTADPRVQAYSVESNFQSIHNHSAYARIDVDKDAKSLVARWESNPRPSDYESDMTSC